MKKPYELLIFDWDGTLMDSVARITHSLQMAAQQENLPVHNSDKMKTCIGLGLMDGMAHLYPDQDENVWQALCENYRYHYRYDNSVATQLFPRAATTIQRLHENGYTLAVATSKSRRGLNHSFEISGLGDYFAISRTADETQSKPHPQMLAEILQEMDMTADQALMIGDSVHDLKMAQNISMDSLGVSYGVSDCETLFAYQPRHCLPSIGVLWDWLHNG